MIESLKAIIFEVNFSVNFESFQGKMPLSPHLGHESANHSVKFISRYVLLFQSRCKKGQIFFHSIYTSFRQLSTKKRRFVQNISISNSCLGPLTISDCLCSDFTVNISSCERMIRVVEHQAKRSNTIISISIARIYQQIDEM